VIEKKKNFKINLISATKNILLMKTYIKLFKRKQRIVTLIINPKIHVPWLKQWTT